MSNELLDRINNDRSFLTSISNNEVEELFHCVDNYIKTNYLFEESEDTYYLKYNDKYYVVGYYTGPETLYYVRISRDKHINAYVDYEDLINNRINKEQQEIKDQIDEINSTIMKLEEKGIPRKLIKRAIQL